MSVENRFEVVRPLDDEDLMSFAFAFNAKTDVNDNSTNCMQSCSDSCCC